MNENFKPGLYRHYKGGLYTAICLVTHHETRKPMVLYVSHSYGGTNVRPLVGWVREGDCRDTTDTDGWLDEVEVEHRKLVPRFQFIGDLPSDTKVSER